MNKKQLIITLVIFTVLLVIAFFALKKEDASWEKGEFANKTPVIENLDVNQIAKFAIFNTKERLEVSIKDDKWVVYNRDFYPADYTKIRDFILKIRDLKIAQKLRIKKNAYGSLKLLPPENDDENNTGTLLVLYNEQGDSLVSLLLGEYHFADKDAASPFSPPVKDGRYVMVSGSDKPVLTSDPLTVATPDPKDWLDRKFIKINDLKSITKINIEGTEEWSIFRETAAAPYRIADLKDNQNPNPKAMHETTSMATGIKFLDVMSSKTSADETGINQADTIEIDSFEGIKYQIKLAVKNKKAFAQFAITLNMPKKRQAGEKEETEEKIKLDKEYETKLNKALEKINEEQFFTKWVYELPLYDAEKLLIKKTALYKEKESPPTIMGE